MLHHAILTVCLLAASVALCLLCALALAVVRDPYQRLNYMSPITSIAITLIVAAIWLENGDWSARIKSALIGLVLFLMNGVLSHATGRAIRIRDLGRWPLKAEENIPLVQDKARAGGKRS